MPVQQHRRLYRNASQIKTLISILNFEVSHPSRRVCLQQLEGFRFFLRFVIFSLLNIARLRLLWRVLNYIIDETLVSIERLINRNLNRADLEPFLIRVYALIDTSHQIVMYGYISTPVVETAPNYTLLIEVSDAIDHRLSTQVESWREILYE